MPATFITDAFLLGRVEALLKTIQGSSQFNTPGWLLIVADANVAAVNEIYGQLTARGFLATQIAGWDRAAEYNLDIGLYWSLVKGAGLSSADDKWVKGLDRRKELETVQVVSAGVWQTPLGPPLAVGVGAMQDYPTGERAVREEIYGRDRDGL